MAAIRDILQAIAEFIHGPGGEVLLFGVLAGLTLFSAVAVAMARRVTHACIALLPCFIGIAGLYAMLASPVMLAFQLLIYAGGIMVLLLFAIFLLERRTGPIAAANHYVLPGLLISGLVAVILLGAIRQTDFSWRELQTPPVELTRPDPAGEASSYWYAWRTGEEKSSNVRRTGFYFMTYYLLPFELTSLILVISMVGAIIMARREKEWVAAGRTVDEAAAPTDRAEGGEAEEARD
jgi:NADH:ubiquinone oxidoreductase subunit 6 (subunit J)